jgi:predicted Zn-ribbon and HTH transcriptional regulator
MPDSKDTAQPQTTAESGYWDCDCGRECRVKEGPERLPNCRAEWVGSDPEPTGLLRLDTVRRRLIRAILMDWKCENCGWLHLGVWRLVSRCDCCGRNIQQALSI